MTEQNVVGLDEVTDPHPFCVVLQEGRPTLAAAASAASTTHVLLDRPLADLDPDLEQLAADSLSAPESPSRRHVADELDRLGWQRRRLPRARSSPPEQAEAGTIPAQNGLRLDDGDRATPRRQQARAEKQLEPIDQVELPALAAASQHIDLVAKHRILEHQLAWGPDHVNGDGSELADLLAWRQLRPHPVHASQDPGPDSRDTWQPHPHLEHMKG